MIYWKMLTSLPNSRRQQRFHSRQSDPAGKLNESGGQKWDIRSGAIVNIPVTVQQVCAGPENLDKKKIGGEIA